MKKTIILSIFLIVLLCIATYIVYAIYDVKDAITQSYANAMSFDPKEYEWWGIKWYWWLLIGLGIILAVLFIFSIIFKFFGKVVIIILIFGGLCAAGMAIGFPFIKVDPSTYVLQLLTL